MGKQILLVDDSPDHRSFGEDQLEDEHQVTTLSGYWDAVQRVQGKSEFDVALLDLLMPAETNKLGGKGMQHLGSEIDVGTKLSVKRALMGIPRIAVATDTGHHDHPVSAMVDWFGEPFSVGGSTLLWMHAPMIEGKKNWREILNRLMAAR